MKVTYFLDIRRGRSDEVVHLLIELEHDAIFFPQGAPIRFPRVNYGGINEFFFVEHCEFLADINKMNVELKTIILDPKKFDNVNWDREFPPKHGWESA